MKRVALSAGHNPKARGACYKGVCEHEVASAWISFIAQELPGDIEVVYVPTGSLPEKVKAINDAKCDLAIEVHFNACGGCGAEGCETLYYPGSISGANAAIHIQTEMAQTGVRDRGVKEGWYRMDRPGVKDYDGDREGDEAPDYFLKHTNCTALIVEPEFIDNYHTFDRIQRPMCRAIARGITECIKNN